MLRLGGGSGVCWGCLWVAQVCTCVPRVCHGVSPPTPCAPGVGEGCWGSKGSTEGSGGHIQVWGWDPPTLLLVATNRLSGVALFSLEGK